MAVNIQSKTIAVAPMLDKTDKHFHFLARLLSSQVILYTEMVTTQALLRHPHNKRWQRSTSLGHIVMQLGGSEPADMAECALIAQDLGYDEVNMNVGCPSSRVKAGRFGACLMREPERVAECVAAMRQKVALPVSIKTRIGVDHDDQYEKLHNFVTKCSDAGCQDFTIHARKAWLNGLSPKQNRTIPPLCYDVVYKLKKDFPELKMMLNGGLDSVAMIEEALQHVDGVMIGRAVCRDMFFLQRIETLLGGELQVNARVVISQYMDYAKQELADGVPMAILLRPLYGLFYQTQGAKHWRRLLNQGKLLFEGDLLEMLPA